MNPFWGRSSILAHHSDFTQTVDNSQPEDDEDCIPINLKLVILLSGKRKSGKDHISTLITNYVGHARMRHLAILRIAGPIKRKFSLDNQLDFPKLLSASDYKEKFREAMVNWSEEYREHEGWNCFLKQAIKEQGAKYKAIWILSDARRTCDLEYFENDPTFNDTKIIKIRVEASETTRMSRGWKFQSNIDDKPTECGLDDYEDWTYVISNNSNDNNDTLKKALRPVFETIDHVLYKLEEVTY